MCVCVLLCVCVWQVEASTLSQQALFLPPPLPVSQKAHLDFQLSDLLVRLSDIGAVKLSAGLHFMTCAMIILLPFTLSEDGGCSSSCNPPPPPQPRAPSFASGFFYLT